MQITPSIHALRHVFRIPVAPGVALDRFVYSFLIFGDTITLVDTGVAGSEKDIFTCIRSACRDPSDIALIVLTHAHPDHIGSARAIQQATGCSIAAHHAERAWIEDIDLQNRERPVPGFAALVGGPVLVDHELSDGDIIETDEVHGGELLVFHTPGHSKGSISLFLQSERALFSGDAIPVAGDLPVYDDATASAQSVKMLRGIADIRFLLSSWDEPRSGNAVYQQMDMALEYLRKIQMTVLALNDEGVTDPAELTKKTASALGLPMEAVSPLLTRTLVSHLQSGGRKNLF
jgi:hydroxyacylglutathione hydrolase